MLRDRALVLFVAVAGLGLLVAPGCKTTKKATGTHYAHFSAEPDRLVAAMEETLKDLEFDMITSSATKVDGRLEARTAQGDKVTIEVTREGDGVSQAGIKVGTFGDSSVSEMIISKTEERLD